MDKNDNIFELVKRMTKSEKRYFKLYACRNKPKEGNRFIQLFDVFEKQKRYDEKKMLVSKQLDNGTKRNFSFNKHYLYKMILDSLNSFHSGRTIDAELKNMLLSLSVLFEKGLVVQCKKVIQKGKKIAWKYENYSCLLDFLMWEKKIIQMQLFEGMKDSEIKSVYKEFEKVILLYKTFNQGQKILAYMSHLSTITGTPRNHPELKVIGKLLQSMNQLESKNNPLDSYFIKSTIYLANYLGFELSGNYKKCYAILHSAIPFLETEPFRIRENPAGYISVLCNFINMQMFLGLYDEAFITINKLKIFPETYRVKSLVIRSEIFYNAITRELDLCIRTGNVKHGLKVIDEIKKVRNDSRLKAQNKEDELIIFYNSSYICFLSGDYVKANNYLNKILNDKTTLRDDIYCFARLLQLIVQYEKGNKDLIEYMVKGTYRYLLKRKQIYQFENAILNFIRKEMTKINSKEEVVESFIRLRKILVKLSKDPFEKRFLDYFDFISWLDSKIEKRSLVEVVKNKINNIKPTSI